MSKRLVIVGGVAAGMSAASKARRLDKELEILVYEQSGHISYGSCGFPYFIKGERLMCRTSANLVNYWDGLSHHRFTG
jgi:NADPH-dependent 2,4-dienoyl-CoA reductase/sulfur reductase-like enzyme